MAKDKISPKTLEQLETEIVGLKIRLFKIEEFLSSFPSVDEYWRTGLNTSVENDDDLLKAATEVVRQYDRVSTSLLQRRLSIGYARAARLIDQLEAKGVIGKSDGSSKPRMVLPIKEEKTENETDSP